MDKAKEHAQKMARKISETFGREPTASMVAKLAAVRAGKTVAQHAEDYMGVFSSVPTMEQLERFVDERERAGAPVANKAINRVATAGNAARAASGQAPAEVVPDPIMNAYRGGRGR